MKKVLDVFELFPFAIRIILDPVAVAKAIRKSGSQAPKIDMVKGPIDGVLGHYALGDDKVTVDVLETIIRNAVPNETRIDEEITKVLLHEVRHHYQYSKYGSWMKADQIAMLILAFLASALFLLFPILRFAWSLAFVDHHYLVAIPLAWFGFQAWRFVKYRLFILCYRFSWSERDARKFADSHFNDPEWRDAFQVQLAVFQPR